MHRTPLPQLSGSLFSRIQGLAKLQEAARSALSTELGHLTTAGKDPGQGVSTDEEASTPGTLPTHVSLRAARDLAQLRREGSRLRYITYPR